MKKIAMFIFGLLLLIPFLVKAEVCETDCIQLVSIDLEEKSDEAVEVTEASIENNRFQLDLELFEVNDYVKYKVVLKNDSEKNYDIGESAPGSDNTISYTIEAIDGDNVIKPGETKGAYLIVRFVNRPTSYDDEGYYNKKEDVALDLLGSIKVTDIVDVVNPETRRGVTFFVILFFASAISLIVLKQRKKYVIVLLLILIPLYVYATCYCKINIDSNIKVPEFKGRNLNNIIKDGAVLDNIASDNVTGVEGIDFLIPSSDTNGKGTYILASTKDDERPVYYYRGEIYNNNVLFGNYCWKMLRTTGTGGVKLVYSGVPVDGKCPAASGVVANNIKFNEVVGNTTSFGYMIGEGHVIQNSKRIPNISSGTVFASSVTYENGKYTLTGDTIAKDASFNSESIKEHHYTCFGGTECTNVSFVFMERVNYIWYINLKNGDTIDDLIADDITNATNENDSVVKEFVDNWYQENMTAYTPYLEDTVWCNDRSLYSRGGWDATGDPHIEDNSKITNKLVFNANYRVSVLGEPTVTCGSKVDSFTVSEENGNGKLEYPVGLITLDEGIMSGFAWSKGFAANKENYLYYPSPFWTMSPSLQSANYMYIGVVYVIADNVTAVYLTNNSGGVKPAISLKDGVKIEDGDGTIDKPFTILELEP